VTPSSPAFIRLVRPRQWVKNAFIVAPLFFTPSAWTKTQSVAVLLTVIVFCLLSSTVYVVNDYADREADRLHPEKKKRPIASGEISAAGAIGIAAVLFAAAAILAITLLPHAVVVVAASYFAINLLYSFWLKHVSILDVLIVAAGFVLRVDAGAGAIAVEPTVWIVICTGLLAQDLSETHRPSLAGYNHRFIDQALAMILGALLVSYLIYTTDQSVIARYGTDKLYLTAPFVIAGVLRYLQITVVEERSGSPTDIALTDRFLIVTMLGWVVVFGLLIYR
jgi:decaprenyl-phosphate phosphoribosyltransferase